jgi:bisdemethoxycurcumin synthase
VHPGGRAILDSVKAELRLEPGTLVASRWVLIEFGNMSSVLAVICVLDEIHWRMEDTEMGLWKPWCYDQWVAA